MLQSITRLVLGTILSFSVGAPLAIASEKTGVGHGGGGDPVAADFAKVAEDAINIIGSASPVFAHGFKIDVARLRAKFAKASIKTVQGPLILDGKVVVAINYPAKEEIVLDRTKWAEIEADLKLQIAIHEFLGLTFPEISDGNYQYSRELADLVRELGSDIKIFARLNARHSDAKNEEYSVIGETMSWVRTEAKTDPQDLNGFWLEISQADGYMSVVLKSPEGKAIFQTKQFIRDTIDFESAINFAVDVDGKHYDQLVLEFQEALTRTQE